MKAIVTMPIGPYNDYSLGKLSTPILADLLSKKMNIDFVMSLNLLDSYKKRSDEGFKKLLESYNITPTKYWIDEDNKDILLNKINELISNGYVYETNKRKYTCDCKKVDISVDNISSINMSDSLLVKKDNDYYCKKCGSICNIVDEKVLVFKNKDEDVNLNFFPTFLNKDAKTFNDTVGKNEIIVSRERDTGVYLDYNNKKYNIDIDFLWGVYLDTLGYDEKIVVCSNHQLYQLYMVGMIEKCFNKDAKTILLATPYLNFTKEEEDMLKERLLSLKLFTLFNLKWSNKENKVDESLIKCLNSMNVNKKNELYDIIINSEDIDSLNDLKDVLLNEFNFQKANQKLKRRRNV